MLHKPTRTRTDLESSFLCVFRITSKGTSTSLTASSPTPPGPTSRSWTGSTCRWSPARRWPSWAAAAAGRAPACSCWRGSTTPITAEWWGSRSWSRSSLRRRHHGCLLRSALFTLLAQLIVRKLYTCHSDGVFSPLCTIPSKNAVWLSAKMCKSETKSVGARSESELE